MEPWTYPSFVDAIVETQRHRQGHLGENPILTTFPDLHPRLVEWLGYRVSEVLHMEIARIRRERLFRPKVFFIQSLRFMTPTEARRINLADSLRFEELHGRAYLARGSKLVDIVSAPLAQRIEAIKRCVQHLREPASLV